MSKCREDTPIDLTLTLKTHLDFLGVDVDVDLGRIDGQEHHNVGITSLLDRPSVGLLTGMREASVSNKSTVDKEIDSLRALCGDIRPREDPFEFEPGS